MKHLRLITVISCIRTMEMLEKITHPRRTIDTLMESGNQRIFNRLYRRRGLRDEVYNILNQIQRGTRKIFVPGTFVSTGWPQKSMPLPNYQNIVLNCIKARL